MHARPDVPVRLIVIDDHPLFREGVGSLIARTDDIELVGHGATGHDAIRLVRELHPDIILMDLHMPDLDGHSAARAIRAMGGALAAAGFTDFVGKPIRTDVLAATIRRHTRV